ncbi:MAG TPA: AraC family transcriptional regulator [Burkholderiaceae bacterium]|jgi:AraC family transcriptional regulator|nr:AraC family transcriptional regulator [Burkholderiaceae bacterium]
MKADLPRRRSLAMPVQGHVRVNTVSTSTGSLRKIDFVDAMLKSAGIVPRSSAAFDEPGALGISCVSFTHRLQSFKPANQLYHGIGYRISGGETIRLDKPASYPGRTGRTGMTALVPAEEESSWESVGPHEMVHFYLSARCLSALAAEIFEVDGGRVQLQEAGFHVDPTIARWAMMFRDRLQEFDPVAELELNAAAHLLGVHLLRRYSNLADRPIPYADQKNPAGLSPMQMQRVREYIRANLARDLDLAELARQARLSPHYFSMRFKHSLGVSPHRYVLGERICEAKQRLATRRMSISEVALSLGFSDQSHFSQTFRKFTGTTPKRFQSNC